MNDRSEQGRPVKALLTGLVELRLVRYLAFPQLAQRLSPSQVQWLREAFVTHPLWVLLTLVATAAALSLPVLIVALRMSRLGPWRYNR